MPPDQIPRMSLLKCVTSSISLRGHIYSIYIMSNLLQISKMTSLCDKQYMQGTIVAMAAKIPKVTLTE